MRHFEQELDQLKAKLLEMPNQIRKVLAGEGFEQISIDPHTGEAGAAG